MSTLLSACGTPKGGGETRPVARLMALGGPMNDQARARRGVEALQTLGFEVDNLTVLTRRQSRFAGSIAERAADLNGLADPAVAMPELIVATRGGYGAIQLLEHLDYDRLCPRLKSSGAVLMGYSDNTSVQLALLARGGVVSWSGPMLYGDFAANPASTYTMNWLRQTLTAGSFSLRVDVPQHAVPTSLVGTLWGGNLTVLTGLVGTPWLPRLADGLLFIEDVGEDVYKVDRMLEQLRLAGILGGQRAILFGHFSGQRPDGYDPGGYTMDRLIERIARQTGVPVFSGLPIGHVADIVPLPIGGHGELIADALGFTLNVSDAPALKRLPAAWTEPRSDRTP